MADIKTGPLPGEAFATYVQVRKTSGPVPSSTGNWLGRWQWIILPKRHMVGINAEVSYLYRFQNSPTNRTKWMHSSTTMQRLLNAINDAVDFGGNEHFPHVLDTPLVIGLNEAEVTQSVQGIPWPVINKAKRVSVPVGGYPI